jgi:hypothetical protein
MMTGEMAAFGIAVGGTSLICYLMMTRLQNRCANRSVPRDGSSPDGGHFAGADSWSTFRWFGGDNRALDSSGNPGDSGGGIAEEALTGAAAMAVAAAAIDNSRCAPNAQRLIHRKRSF